MKALIIAAGSGSRFGKMTESHPKPLINLGNRFLIQNVMDSLIKGGVNEIYISVGYMADMMKEELGEEYLGVPLHFIENTIWEKGNLTSLYAAKGHIDGEFLLSMSDHLFDPSIVSDIIGREVDETVLLAVDRKYQQVDDDMKVLVRGEMIRDIGKNIMGNFVDIGLFRMKDRIFDYAGKMMEEGNFQLFMAVKEAALGDDARVMDIERRFWTDVDTPEELNSYYVQRFPGFIKNGKWD